VLIRREPRLEQLQAELAAVRDEGGPSFCANRLWYVRYGPELKRLVGSDAEVDDPLLRTNDAYELSRHVLYRLLPDCRDCVCVPW
jgi:hypothetical protein